MALISALALNLSQAATLSLFGSGETLSCDGTQDIAPPVDPALLQASKHIPKKEVPRLDDSDSFGILFVPALANDDALLV